MAVTPAAASIGVELEAAKVASLHFDSPLEGSGVLQLQTP